MPEPSAPKTDDDVETARYDFDTIDLESGSTHADVVKLVGEGRRVLELGPATGYMSRMFVARGCTVVGIELDEAMAKRAAEHCERVIVGDLDTLDLQAELGDDRFDVIVAADVLEHLKDPTSVLVRLRELLTEDGFVVLSLPNVAHGSVRLALLNGRFDYQEIGLLDRTHLTFFTRQSIERMLDEAELGMATLHRHELNLDASEVPFDADAVPAELRAALDADLDSRTYQFVVKAVPMARAGLREVQRQLRELARERDETELELERMRAAADRAAELEAAFAEMSGREGQLRHSLIEAHDQLLRRDADLDRAKRRLAELEHEVEYAGGQIAWRDEEMTRLRTRLDRILTSPPGRLYASLRSLPGLRKVAAQRQAGFLAEVQKRRQNG